MIHKLRIVVGGDEAAVPTAILHVHTERLDVAAGDVRAVLRRRLEDAKGTRFRANYGQRAVGMRQFNDGRAVFHRAQVSGIVKIDGGNVFVEHALEGGAIQQAGLRGERNHFDRVGGSSR